MSNHFGSRRLLRSLVAIALFVLSAAPRARAVGGPVRFTTFDVVATDRDPWGLASADFDCNGFNDLAVTESLSDSVRVFLFGNGGFVIGEVSISTGRGPSGIAAGDFDSDGFEDIAVALYSDAAIDVFLNDRVGGFAASRPVASDGLGSIGIVARDFDGDGRLDLLLGAYAQERLSLVLGDGTGSFAPGASAPAPGGPFAIDAADFDGDGFLDVAAAIRQRRRLAIYRNEGGRSFTAVADSPVETEPLAAAAGDFDGDGDADMAVANQGTGTVQRFENHAGNGEFSLAQRLETGFRPSALAARDLDGDGLADLLVASLLDMVAIYRSAGEAFEPAGSAGVGQHVRAILLSDLDGDELEDLAASCVWTRAVAIVRREPGAAFASPGIAPVDGEPHTLSTGDFDGDGAPDVVLGRFDPRSLVTCFGDGRGGIRPGRSFTLGFYPTSTAVADFDGNGLDDVAAAGFRNGGALTVARSGAGGSLSTMFATGGGTSASHVLAADLREDGRPDVVFEERETVTEIVILSAEDPLSFAETDRISEGQRLGRYQLGDFDGDGHADVLASFTRDGAGSGFLRFRGDGTGRIDPPTFHPIEASALDLACDDIDADGRTDVAYVFGYSRPGLWWRRSTVVDFGPAQIVSDQGTSRFSSADIDADGFPDFVQLGVPTAIRGFTVIRNLAGAGFSARLPVAAIAVPEVATVAADFDLDGLLDVAVAGRSYDRRQSGRGSVAIVLNRTLDSRSCRAGNVNAGAGTVADVLFVNGSAGESSGRFVDLGSDEPIEVTMAAPPFVPGGPAPFALGAWISWPTIDTVRGLPPLAGRTCFSMRAADARPLRRRLWNNLGGERLIGTPTLPSSPAPSVVLRLPAGLGRPARFFLQGVIRDPNAISAGHSVTNGVAIEVR